MTTIKKEKNNYMKEKIEGTATIKENITLIEVIDLLISKGVISFADLEKINFR